MGNTVVKSTASKVRKIEKRDVVAGFAGSTADALTLFERLEGKLEKHAGNLSRAAVELAKDWRTDKYLRRLEALMAVGTEFEFGLFKALETALNFLVLSL